MFKSELSFFSTNNVNPLESLKKIKLEIVSKPCSPETIVNQLASIKGAVDIYFWYIAGVAMPAAHR